jgi:hypothetical protein
MAEEIALHLALDAAAGVVADEGPELDLFTRGMPKSRFDFDFDLLHDVLYQGLPDPCAKGFWERVPPVDDAARRKQGSVCGAQSYRGQRR